MPLTELHKKKLKKNLIIGGMIFLWCALIWAVTMIKIARADPMNSPSAAQMSGVHVGRIPADMDGPFYPDRSGHQMEMIDRAEDWKQKYFRDGEERQEHKEQTLRDRHNQLDIIYNRQDSWLETYHNSGMERLEQDNAREDQRTRWQQKMEVKPEQWWETWSEHQQAKSE